MKYVLRISKCFIIFKKNRLRVKNNRETRDESGNRI